MKKVQKSSMMDIEIHVCQANKEDTIEVARIYNDAIRQDISTFDSFQVSSGRFESLISSDEQSTLLVAKEQGVVIGWGSISPISERWAYRVTCKISVFIALSHQLKGVGKTLTLELLATARRFNYYSVISEVMITNRRCISMRLGLGFNIVGEIRNAGFRNNCWIGLIIMQKQIKEFNMKERELRISITTKNLTQSVDLYQNQLGLSMRPMCNAIAMFPLGYVELEICQDSESKELLGVGLGNQSPNGILMSVKRVKGEIEAVVSNALSLGGERMDTDVEGAAAFRDFNGIMWLIEPDLSIS